MDSARVSVTVASDLLSELDQLISQHVFPNRAEALDQAVRDKLSRLKRNRLEAACRELNPIEERAMAEEGMQQELANWPEY